MTALGSLIVYITDSARRDFQPINANFGLMPELAEKVRGRDKKIALGNRALAAIDDWIDHNELADGVAALSSPRPANAVALAPSDAESVGAK
jgi:methylenetetrahydrofolate--tRNA-(uracil-5-)-methyltransferase